MTAPTGFGRECGPGGLEARIVPNAGKPTEARGASGDAGPIIEGYGSVADQRTTIEGMFSDWDEEVAQGAWSATIKAGDIRAMFNHDTNQLLGRTKAGTLRLSEDDDGLFYEIDVNPDDPIAMGVHAKVARGDVDGSSVWFRVVRQEWTHPTEENGLERSVRRILEGQLFETGPVTFPAFEQTTSSARSLAPFDAVLRAAGVGKAAKRAEFGDRLAAGEDLEAELRHLFDSAPDLRAAVCACNIDGRAADPAPEGAAELTPDPTATRSLTLMRAQWGFRRHLPPA